MFEKAIGTINAAASFRHRYDNFIGGRWSAPAGGEYFADTSPINGAQIAEFALSTPEYVERALDAAHAAKDQWARIAPAERARILNRVADRLEDNLDRCFASTGRCGSHVTHILNAVDGLLQDHKY